MWVRRHPDVQAAGLRFCSLDRPGYGFSRADPAPLADQHFGRVAKLTAGVLEAQGVEGNLILVYHSLGGYHALVCLLSRASDGWFRGGSRVSTYMSCLCVCRRWQRTCGTHLRLGFVSWDVWQ